MILNCIDDDSREYLAITPNDLDTNDSVVRDGLNIDSNNGNLPLILLLNSNHYNAVELIGEINIERNISSEKVQIDVRRRMMC